MAKNRQPRKAKNIVPTSKSLENDWEYLFEKMSSRSHRDMALSATAYLDDMLSVMFRKTLHDEGEPEGDFIKKLMRNGPLGSLSARIDMAYALGWFGAKTRNSLHSIREIRNSFAHQYQVDSFDHPDTKDLCDKLRDDLPLGFESLKDRDQVFLLAATSMIAFLSHLGDDLKRSPEGMEFERAAEVFRRLAAAGAQLPER